MSAHTPGPWVVNALPSDPYVVFGGGIHGNGEPRQICVTANGFFGCDESIANARLIAAAPDLLAALVAVLNDFPGTKNARTEAARSAIAKATGEAT